MKNDITVHGTLWDYCDHLKQHNLGERVDRSEEKKMVDKVFPFSQHLEELLDISNFRKERKIIIWGISDIPDKCKKPKVLQRQRESD